MKKDFVKDCPCCGGKSEYNEEWQSELYGFDVPYVECLVCGLRNFESSKEEAIENWNKRKNGWFAIGVCADPAIGNASMHITFFDTEQGAYDRMNDYMIMYGTAYRGRVK